MRLYFEETLLVQVVKLSLLTLAISQCLPPTALGISPEEFVACEMEAFEREKDQFLKETHLESTRSKRTIKFNGRAPIDLGMLFGFPLTLTLPSLSNYFQFNKDKKKRSIPTEVESEDVYEENPFLQPQVDRISAYFHLINVTSHSKVVFNIEVWLPFSFVRFQKRSAENEQFVNLLQIRRNSSLFLI